MKLSNKRKLIYSFAVLFSLFWLIRKPHLFRSSSTGLFVKPASDTCFCYDNYSDRLLYLQALRDDKLTLNGYEIKPSDLEKRLEDIFATRAQKLVYLSANPELDFQEVAKLADRIQSITWKEPLDVPPELQSRTNQNMQIKVVLVTPAAIDAPCQRGCYNWDRSGIPVVTGAQERIIPR